MEVVNDLEELTETLQKLKRNFNDQMNASNSDMKEFHSQMLSLTAAYPEHKDLLEFIVFINDRIETNQTQVKEVILDSINEMLEVKKNMVKLNIKMGKNVVDLKKSKETSSKSSISKYITSFSDIKFLIVSALIVIGLAGAIFLPADTAEKLSHNIAIVMGTEKSSKQKQDDTKQKQDDTKQSKTINKTDSQKEK